LLLERPELPDAAPSTPPTSAPVFCAERLSTSTMRTSVMRPYWTEVWANAMPMPATPSSSAAAMAFRFLVLMQGTPDSG